MSAEAEPLSESVVVDRLRAAGCVFAEDEARLLVSAAGTPELLSDLVQRRVTGVPLEHLLGWAEFCGLRIQVDEGVFVPRRRSEHLARTAIGRAPRSRVAVVVDLCCGSGALGAAVAVGLGTVELYAADVDPAAVRCARRNLDPLGGTVYEGDLYDALPDSLRSRVDLLLANAPYVPTDEIGLMPPEARLHEARVALDGGTDGLGVLRRVIAEAPAWLAPGGHLLVESSERQAPLVVDAVTAAGLTPGIEHWAEAAGTVVVGNRVPDKPLRHMIGR